MKQAILNLWQEIRGLYAIIQMQIMMLGIKLSVIKKY